MVQPSHASFVGVLSLTSCRLQIINQLGVVADAFGPEIQAKLSKEPTRKMTPENVNAVQDRGVSLH